MSSQNNNCCRCTQPEYYLTLNTQGPQGRQGEAGEDGFSPSIEVNTNTDTEYTLTITTADGTITTPNLKATIPTGGTTGQVLTKYSDASGAYGWRDLPEATETVEGIIRKATVEDFEPQYTDDEDTDDDVFNGASNEAAITPYSWFEAMKAGIDNEFIDITPNTNRDNTYFNTPNKLMVIDSNGWVNIYGTSPSSGGGLSTTYLQALQLTALTNYGSYIMLRSTNDSTLSTELLTGGYEDDTHSNIYLTAHELYHRLVYTDNTPSVYYKIIDENDIATTDQLGIVKPDGTTITITEDGTITAVGGGGSGSGSGSNASNVQDITNGIQIKPTEAPWYDDALSEGYTGIVSYINIEGGVTQYEDVEGDGQSATAVPPDIYVLCNDYENGYLIGQSSAYHIPYIVRGTAVTTGTDAPYSIRVNTSSNQVWLGDIELTGGSGGVEYTAGDGIEISDNTISVSDDVVLNVNGDLYFLPTTTFRYGIETQYSLTVNSSNVASGQGNTYGVQDEYGWMISKTSSDSATVIIGNTNGNIELAIAEAGSLIVRRGTQEIDLLNQDGYSLPIASTDTLGGIKIGTGLEVLEDGTVNVTVTSGEGTTDYEALTNKPSINGVELVGNLTTTDLGIEVEGGTTDYDELTNKPSINDIELTGNKTLAELGIQAAGDYALSDDIPTTLPNPYALTISYNGVQAFTYDGSSAETGNFIVNATTVPMSDSDTTTIAEALEGKQDTLTAGTNITIADGVISATGTEVDLSNYVTNDSLATTLELYATQDDLDDYVTATELTNSLSGYATTSQLSAKQDVLSAGTGISIEGNVISCTVEAGEGGITEEELTEALEPYALKTEIPTDYLTSSDLEGYATTSYVDEQIAGIEVPSLDGYVTSTDLEEALADKQDTITSATATVDDTSSDNPTCTVSFSDGTISFNFSGIKGEQGEAGAAGAQGATGPQGEQGPAGENGVGVPTGGTTGQVLSKTSDTDYDTEWVTIEQPDLSDYVTTTELTTTLSDYALKTEIPDISDLATTTALEAVEEKVDAITVPTKVSELENDSGYLTSADLPTGSLLYWTGTADDYEVITTKNMNTLYRLTDTNEVYLGDILLSATVISNENNLSIAGLGLQAQNYGNVGTVTVTSEPLEIESEDE